jgi:uncharacterized protein
MAFFSHLMLLPTLNCPARCGYCFGPHQGSPTMSRATLEATARWARRLGIADELEITFHGGEPLLAGRAFYETALPLLREALAPHPVRFGVQSNLWLLNDDLCRLFRQYEVSLGTSLDGPEEINDAQRGRGYFARTMEGIRRARQHGLSVGVICTITRQSAARADEVFDFFLRQGLGFSLHAALPALGQARNGWSLPPEAAAPLFVRLFDRYVENVERIRIGTFDALCRSLSAGEGGICTFTDCLGRYLAVDPEGWIYPCQRLAGFTDWRLGNVHDCPAWDDLARAPAWQAFAERQTHIAEACGDCPHLAICRGGCPYNALAADGGRFADLRDPHCSVYRQLFDHISERALAEVFAEENLMAVVENGPGRYGLLQHGRVLRLMRGGAHPQQVAAQARRTLAAFALGVSGSVEEAVTRLERLGVVTDRALALGSVGALARQLHAPPNRLLNAYLHVTYACNLACAHCYAQAAPSRRETMPVEDVLRLTEEAARLGFAKAVITGGEPLLHPQRDALLEGLADLRARIRPTQIVLRTNLTLPLDDALLERLRRAADQIVVSLDGDEAAHDARRGAGTYARTLANLRRVKAIFPSGGLSVTAVLTAAQVNGREGEAVRRVAQELGIAARFKPLLPLGRAASRPPALEAYASLEAEGEERLACGLHLTATCGLGMNISVAPDGVCTPCHALGGEAHALGNARQVSLQEVIAGEGFQRLKQVTVDSTPHCRACPLRYLCGGYCRAWRAGEALDAPPADCAALRGRAQAQLRAALEALAVPPERWRVAFPTLRLSDYRTIRLFD